MISGLSSSGIASAIRTAGQARATMDTMARQIATGQKVASVRDDGAAWAIANRARSDALASRQLGSDLQRLGETIHTAVLTGEVRVDILAAMQARAVSATNPGLAASTRTALERAQLEDDATQTLMSWNQVGDVGSLRNSTGSTWGPFSIQGPRDDLTWVSDINGGTTSSAGGGAITALGSLADLSTVSSAATAAAESARFRDFLAERVVIHTAIGSRLKSDGAALNVQADRLDQRAAGLTDADLGKASAARAKAETRQQLALSTVRQAISAYGSFASGLLGNVQRTQRGILA